MFPSSGGHEVNETFLVLNRSKDDPRGRLARIWEATLGNGAFVSESFACHELYLVGKNPMVNRVAQQQRQYSGCTQVCRARAEMET